jgi:hypothetical protein
VLPSGRAHVDRGVAGTISHVDWGDVLDSFMDVTPPALFGA